jgi:hypothetical protein
MLTSDKVIEAKRILGEADCPCDKERYIILPPPRWHKKKRILKKFNPLYYNLGILELWNKI